ncbi:hypothetical protein LTR36_003350 [Oleoguttula mirabilis]|uniref:Uncharacterized protein n=1 Tax=Oleoguttula mirabilis TaxID=1507867 RepID=A0AAV9K0J1_9PEZI|nr:hypothetical protein LTR36_003350 [Oleoguttula mirabilis]
MSSPVNTERGILTDVSVNKVLNLTEVSTLVSLRTQQHKDVNGNVIVDPDLSNPTRPRLERPLDTIRSFEKAIDNGYKRRSSHRAETSEQDNQFTSRRSSSYFGGGEYMKPTNKRQSVANGGSAGYDSGPSPGRNSAMGGGYYGGQRPDSYMGHQNGPQRMRYGNRVQSDGAMNGYGRPYPPNGPHQSQDTMHTGVSNGSDSTGPWASNTEPSSENSSIDKNLANGKQPESYGQNGYGPNSYGGPVIMEEQGAPAYGSNGYGQNGGPVQSPSAPRKPIALGNSGSAPGGSLPTNTRPEPEKKKGWLTRRFSKKE